ncbi:hypothetical protein ACFL27_20220 [candidate division CSSED10-310 bacterium]|uniref:SGNH hydrolase-type esterase domain-containing protein n=1 Tax=candidate division CSSED10-310 bacterium TaxID=2855610 RepID=A0ABV6Z249_UNCC1
MKSKLGPAVLKISLALLSLVLCLVLAELTIRFFSLDQVIEEEMHNTSENADYGNRVRIDDPDIGWFLKGYDFSGDRLVINFEKPRIFERKKPNNTFRILVLGDSVAEVWTTWDPDQKFSRMLENDLNKKQDSIRYEIINVSVGSYNTAHRAALLRKWFYDWDFDLILVQHSLHDDLGSYHYDRTDGKKDIFVRYSRDIRGLKFFKDSKLLNSALIRFVNLRLFNTEYFKESAGIIGFYPNKQRQHYEWIKNHCHSRQMKLFVLIFPYLLDYSKHDLLIKHERLDQMLNDLNIPHYDLYDDFMKARYETLQGNPEDFCHPNFKGHLIAMRKLREQLYNKHILPQTTKNP